jgi:hypothetical protein
MNKSCFRCYFSNFLRSAPFGHEAEVSRRRAEKKVTYSCIGTGLGIRNYLPDPDLNLKINPDSDPTLKPGQLKNWQIVSVYNGNAARLFTAFLRYSKEIDM